MALVGDIQRERALATLRHHYLQGRLDVDELAARADRAVRARTTGDLQRALRGLPRLSEMLERGRETVRVVGYLTAVGAIWCVASAFLLIVLIALAFAGTGIEILVVPGLWAVLSALLYTAGARRLRRR
jgi:DUF1707 SHOCT-like domain